MSDQSKSEKLPHNEISAKTKIPHYQIYLEFKTLVRTTQLQLDLEEIFGDRVHIATKKVYNANYQEYCQKLNSNFNYDCKYYWNIKYSSDLDIQVKEASLNLLVLKKNLQMIKRNYFTGQKLLLNITKSEPDGRSTFWICDIIGGTGKTGFFQTLIDDPSGLYLGISDGTERLSAKIRKRVLYRLKNKLGYPKFVWMNFGRTVSENVLKTFAIVGEQILDGMIDDNFGNTGGDDFLALPDVHLFVTANTPPNLNHLI